MIMDQASDDRKDGRDDMPAGSLLDSVVGLECSFSDGLDSMPVKRTTLISEKAPAWFTKEYDEEWSLRMLTCYTPAITAGLPFSKSVTDIVCSKDSAPFWSSEAGGSSIETDSPHRFIAQTPKDGGPFCSFAITTTGWGRGIVSGIYHYTDAIYDCSDFLHRGRFYSGWRSGGWQIQVLPVAFLATHVSHKAKEVSSLSRRVTSIENIVTSPNGDDEDNLDFGMLTRKLHECHTELFRLERRAHFESGLAKNIELLLDAATKDRARCEQLIKTPLDLAKSMMEAQSYDLQALPKRIESQRVMIFNLIIQRDARMNLQIGRTNMEIADTSRRIAETSLRDSASMKTIAILTMVFLPGTAVASFFSMTMFNWAENGSNGRTLASPFIWVYFVTSIPLTAIVLGIWYMSLRKRRASRQSEILLSPRLPTAAQGSHNDKLSD